MGIQPVEMVTPQEKTIKKALKRAKDQKAGKPVKYQDFLSEPVSKKTQTKYRAAIKMADTEKELSEKNKKKKKMSGKITKRPMGGKVYKVDNSGQMLVQRMYGGKIKK
jgi:flavin-dependent dehydrogenase